MTLGRESSVDLRLVTDWPNLLAGPIVRKVERGQAWVFVATKIGGTAKLLVREGTHNYEDVREPDPTAPAVAVPPYGAGDAAPLRQVGENLFVALISAPLAGPSGATYSYDVKFDWTGAGEQRLNDLGLLGNPVGAEPTIEEVLPLGYEVNRCPSFLSPPATAEALRIAHASCRKPHGAEGAREADALPILDQIVHHSLPSNALQQTNEPDSVEPYPTTPKDLNKVWVDRMAETLPSLPQVPPADICERPHQLVLTGDQIYADDVAPGMLDALTDAGDKLLGWLEILPGIEWGLNGFLVQPGWRTRYLSMSNLKELPAEDGIDYSQSHLLKFGEWCAMYLFAWSTALWPRDDENLLGVRSSRYRVPISEAVTAVDVASAVATFNLSVTKVLKKYNGITTAMSIGNRLDDFDEALAELWDSTLDQCGTYASTVPYVRRLLANIATYTMFDDHEITDDWFINRKVADGLLGLRADDTSEDLEGIGVGDVWQERVGPRMLRNGLSAYAIFQHWGNAPEDFSAAGSPGNQLLEMWEPDGSTGLPELADRHAELRDETPWWMAPALSQTPTTPEPDGWITELPDHVSYDTLMAITSMPDPDTQNADRLLRIDQRPPPNGQYDPGVSPAGRTSFGRFRWDYAITFDSHRLIALDSRTWRYFPESVDSAFGFGGSPAGADPAEETMAIIRDVAEGLQNTSSVACSAYGGLLEAACDVASASSSSSIQFARAFCDQAASFVVAMNLPVLANPQAPDEPFDPTDLALEAITAFRDDFDESTEFDARPVMETSADRAGRCGVLLEVIVSEIGQLSGDLVIAETAYMLAAVRRYLQSLLASDPRDPTSTSGFIHGAVIESSEIVQNLAAMVDHPDSALRLDDLDDLEAVGDKNFTAEADLELLVVPPDDRSFRFFRDGSHYLAVELISQTALEFQLEHPLALGGDDHKATVLLSPAPIFGNELVETVQDAKFLNANRKGVAALEEWDYEAWSANPVGMNNLMIAGRSLRECIVLSGDVHYANSSMNVARIRSEGVETSYGQLTSSSSRNADWKTRLGAAIDDLSWQRRLDYVMNQFSPVPIFSGALDKPVDPALQSNAGDFIVDPDTAASTWRWLLQEYWEDFPWNLIKYAAGTYLPTDPFEHIEQMKKDYDQFRYDAQQASTHDEYVALRKKWLWDPSLDFILEAIDHIATAPLHSFVAWVDEIAWMLYSTLQHVHEFYDDPIQKIFDHYLFSRDVLTQFIHDAYKVFSVDPAYGLNVDRLICRDIRDPRFTLYPGRVRYKDPKVKEQVTLFAHSTSVQTVGEANVGLVRFIRHPSSLRTGFRHELLFYPFPEPQERDVSQPEVNIGQVIGEDLGGGVVDDLRRTDWTGTRHEAWFDYAPKNFPYVGTVLA